MPFCPQCHQRVNEWLCPTCRSSTVPDPSEGDRDLVGQVIADRFEVMSLGDGGGAWSVYLARDRNTNTPAALKVLTGEASREFGNEFEAGARSWACMEGANTVRVLGFGRIQDGRAFVAMEHLAGRTLRAEMKDEGRLPEQRIVEIAIQVCRSLSEAHALGIVHRDLRPENLFVASFPGDVEIVKVSNYGVGRPSDRLTPSMAGVGTPRYMSPELCRGDRIDGRSDLYSLGILMYEAAAGSAPYQADTPTELLLKHVYDRPLRLSAIWPDTISKAFDDLVMDLIAKRKDARPRDASEVIERLAPLQAPTMGTREEEPTPLLQPAPPTFEDTGEWLVMPPVEEQAPAAPEVPAARVPEEGVVPMGSLPGAQTETARPLPRRPSIESRQASKIATVRARPVLAKVTVAADPRVPAMGETVDAVPAGGGPAEATTPASPAPEAGGPSVEVVVEGTEVEAPATDWTRTVEERWWGAGDRKATTATTRREIASPWPAGLGIGGFLVALAVIGFWLFGGPWGAGEATPPANTKPVATDTGTPAERPAAPDGAAGPAEPAEPVRPAPRVAPAHITSVPPGATVTLMPHKRTLGRTPVDVLVIEGQPVRLRVVAQGLPAAEVEVDYDLVVEHKGIEVNLRR